MAGEFSHPPLKQLRAEVEVLSVDSTTGGGSSALVRLPSFAVSLKPAEEGEEGLAEALRRGDPAVMARIEGGRVLLDVRTLLPGDDDAIVAAAERW